MSANSAEILSDFGEKNLENTLTSSSLLLYFYRRSSIAALLCSFFVKTRGEERH